MEMDTINKFWYKIKTNDSIVEVKKLLRRKKWP